MTAASVIHFADPLAAILAGIRIDGITVDQQPVAYEQLVACGNSYFERYAADGRPSAGEVPGVQAARKFFRAIGVEPTRRRPSSESLLNRALKQKGFYSVNTLVDTGNWCSLDFLLPIGVYDADRISGQVVFKKGGAADRYAAINQREINFEGRYVLADDHGAFGSPMTDSLRTAVQPDTVRTFLVMYAPADYPRDTFRRQSETLAERVVDICGGRVVSLDIIAG